MQKSSVDNSMNTTILENAFGYNTINTAMNTIGHSRGSSVAVPGDYFGRKKSRADIKSNN